MLGYLSLIDEGAAGPVTDEQRETLSEVKASSEKLLALIGDLLDLTSLKRRELPVQVATFDPRDAVRDALAIVGSAKSGVDMIVEGPTDNAIPR